MTFPENFIFPGFPDLVGTLFLYFVLFLNITENSMSKYPYFLLNFRNTNMIQLKLLQNFFLDSGMISPDLEQTPYLQSMFFK